MDKQPLRAEHYAALISAYRLLKEPRGRCVRCARYSPYYGVCTACRRGCDHDICITGYIVKSNGTEQPMRVCLGCGTTISPRKGAQFPVHDLLLRDLRDDRGCERCGDTRGVELHHYAPRNTFRDADEWATGWLCVPCHREWHTSMDGYRWHARAKHAQ